MLCGLEVTSSQVSRAAAELDEQLTASRDRPIGEITYLILDARYGKIRHGEAVVPCGVLTAIGVSPDGKRAVLGCSVEVNEVEHHWRTFRQSLPARGMRGMKLVVSDDHAGLEGLVTRHQKPAPGLADWLEVNVPVALTVLGFPPAHRRRLRTTNGVERLNKEIERRTRDATLFPNEASLLRLVSAVLREISDDRETERSYLNMEAC